MNILGITCSSFNSVIDFDSLKRGGVRFAFVRMSRGMRADSGEPIKLGHRKSKRSNRNSRQDTNNDSWRNKKYREIERDLESQKSFGQTKGPRSEQQEIHHAQIWQMTTGNSNESTHLNTQIRVFKKRRQKIKF